MGCFVTHAVFRFIGAVLNYPKDANTLLTLTWPMCQIWHILFLQILNAPADCMVKQTL